MTSFPEGANRLNFGPSSGGPARPPALRIPTPTSGAGPPGDASRHRVSLSALVQYRLIRARRWPPCGWVRRAPRRGLVGVRRLRDALRRITGHGVRMPAPGPPTAARLIVLPPIASNGCAPSRWSAVGEGAAAGRSGRSGGRSLSGVWGCNPLPWSRPRRRAGRRFAVKGAALVSPGEPWPHFMPPPLWGGVKYSRSLYFANAYHIQ